MSTTKQPLNVGLIGLGTVGSQVADRLLKWGPQLSRRADVELCLLKVLVRDVDKRRSIDEMVQLGFDRALVERVDRMVATSEFKRQVPPIAKLGPRTAGVDYLYPRRRPGSARG